ncbi:pilus assembly protein [soil metagenome]
MSAPSRLCRKPRQRGVYAVEYAIVFPIFFLLLYGIISYGIIFALRLGMQTAAEDGARAGLRYCGTQLTCRTSAASAEAVARMTWLKNATVTAKACPIGVDCPVGTAPICGSTLPTRCQIVVTVDYDYTAHPLAPPLPGLGLLLPTSVQGRASVLLVDGKVGGGSS